MKKAKMSGENEWEVSYLDLLFNLSLQLINLLGESLFPSGQLRNKGFLLLKLTAKFTWW